MKKLDVLIVDDDTDLLEMVSLVLTHHDMQVRSLSAGSTFITTVAAHKPDVVVMDIYLGDSDGRDLCRELKTTAQYDEIPVILYSAGNITPGSIKESLADHFLTKPFDISNLVDKIKSLGLSSANQGFLS